ncbi:MAG: VanW family protein, partial [Anaerolineae bacterium]
MNERTNPSSDQPQPFRPPPPARPSSYALPPSDDLPPMAPRHRRRRTTLPALPLLLALLLCVVVTTIIAGSQVYYRGRIAPGVRVLGEDVGSMTRAQAEARLQDKLGDPNQLLARLGGGQIALRDGAQVYRAWPWEIGFRSDFKPALDAAMGIAHRGNLYLDLVEQVRALALGADVSISSAFDEATARAYLISIAPQIDRPARDAQLKLDGLRVVEIPAVKGRRLDVDETVKRIQARLLDPSGADIVIAVVETDPQTTDTTAARNQISNFLRSPLVLTFGDRSWAIDQATLVSFISIKPVASPDGSIRLTAALDHNALVAEVKALAREIDQSPRDARFHFQDGALITTLTSQEGRTLDADATVKQIEQKFTDASATGGRTPGNASPIQPSPLQALRENTLALNVRVQKPAVDMRDASKMGIKELVAQGVSNFRHSIPGRIQNIKTATSSFDGVVIPPGGVFSFDKYLVDVVEANGYEDAYVIFGNRTVLGPGGGVCQVSSTMFRAAFWGGFPIVERWAHAYRVGYYEPPVGLDATVFAPDVDFKFKNDTNAYLLIEPVLDEKNTTLTFNLYGTKPNREVKMVGPEETNVKPHGPAIYNDDP